MGNYSRNTFKSDKRYVSVRLQQGVPIVDADWNEAHDIRKVELETFLKSFVGDGVPGKDDFKIRADSTANDFTIGAGSCLVSGWTALNGSDVRYTRQAGVPALNPVPEDGGERTDTVYLDVWEREVDAGEDTNLVNEALGIETCVRMKREWVVRVAEGATAPPTPPKDHFFYALATLHRKANQVEIHANDVTDLRHTGLTLASLKERTDSLEMDKVDRAGDRITGDLVVDGGLDLLTPTPYGLRARTTETQDDTSVRIAVEAPAEQGKVEIDWINKASYTGGGYGLLQVGKNTNSPPLSLRGGNMELFFKGGTVAIGKPNVAPVIVLTDRGDFNANGRIGGGGTVDAWSKKRTGLVAFDGLSEWQEIPGLSISFTLTRSALVQLAANGTQRCIDGTIHCAYRYVVDGTPKGHPDHGQRIQVSDITTSWWNTWSLMDFDSLDAGDHTIAVEARNSTPSGKGFVCGEAGLTPLVEYTEGVFHITAIYQ